MYLHSKILVCFFILNGGLCFIDEEEVDNVIKQVLKCHPNHPGLTFSIVRDGKTILAKGYGVTDLVSKRPVTNTTLFQMSSLSKGFSATLLMQLLHLNKSLNIHSLVSDILGEDFEFSTKLLTENANLCDLLSHSLGIAPHLAMNLDPAVTRDTLASRMKYLNPVATFRQSLVYNGQMFGLINKISEILGDKSWEDLINDVIYQPLGMTSSNFISRIDPSDPDLAQGYLGVDEETGDLIAVPFDFTRVWMKVTGSNGMISNGLDMAKWMNFHLYGGKNAAGEQIVHAESLSNIYKPWNANPSSGNIYFAKPKVPVTSSGNSYGFGWINGYYRGYRIVRHGGSNLNGYFSVISLMPDMEIGVYLSMTGNDNVYLFRELLHTYLYDIALGVKPWLNISTLCSFPEPWYPKQHAKRQRISKRDHSISKRMYLFGTESKYIGSYHNGAYGSLNIIYNTTLGTLEMKYGIGRWALYPTYTYNEFYGEALGIIRKILDLPSITFQFEGSNDITSVMVERFEYKDPPLFDKIPNDHNSKSTNIMV